MGELVTYRGCWPLGEVSREVLGGDDSSQCVSEVSVSKIESGDGVLNLFQAIFCSQGLHCILRSQLVSAS